MSLSNVHPSYSNFISDWILMRDSFSGERQIKERGEVYLPATAGQQLDGLDSSTARGRINYEAYKLRAVFPDFVSVAVETMLGFLHQKPPMIQLPTTLEPLLENCSLFKESLQNFLRRINEQQLIAGRCGILLDLPKNPDPANPLPYLSLYNAENILNWDESSDVVNQETLNLVILDESSQERIENFNWKFINKYRVLVLGDTEENENKATYFQGFFVNTKTYNPTELFTPTIRGSALNKIPFVFVNSKDIIPQPDKPSLIGLANLCVSIYRSEADYRQALHQQGQDTLVVVSGNSDGETLRVGAGARIDVEQGGDAKFIGINSSGIPEQRQALENDKTAAQEKAARLIQSAKNNQESGIALKIRISAQTATLKQIALTGAQALTTILRTAAEWIGANPDEVVVTPNLEFSNSEFNPKNVVDLMSARTMGAPISKKSVHEYMQDNDLTKMNYEDEIELIQEEDAQLPNVVEE